MERREVEQEITELVEYFINKHFKRLDKIIKRANRELGPGTEICDLFADLSGDDLKEALIREALGNIPVEAAKESIGELICILKVMRLIKLIPSWITGKILTTIMNREIDSEIEKMRGEEHGIQSGQCQSWGSAGDQIN